MCGVVGEGLEFDTIFVDPLGIRFLGCKLRADLLVIKNFSGFGVGGEHLTGAEAAATDDFFVRQNNRSGFGANIKKSVFGEGKTGWPEAVAIETCAKGAAIGETQSGGAVPGFGEGADVVIKGAFLFGQVRIVAEGGWHEHAHGVLEPAAGQDQDLKRVVERCRVGLAVAHEVFDEFNIFAPKFRTEEFLARSHPVSVSAHRVDFAVVAHHAEGLSEGPRREGVG